MSKNLCQFSKRENRDLICTLSSDKRGCKYTRYCVSDSKYWCSDKFSSCERRKKEMERIENEKKYSNSEKNYNNYKKNKKSYDEKKETESIVETAKEEVATVEETVNLVTLSGEVVGTISDKKEDINKIDEVVSKEEVAKTINPNRKRRSPTLRKIFY